MELMWRKVVDRKRINCRPLTEVISPFRTVVSIEGSNKRGSTVLMVSIKPKNMQTRRSMNVYSGQLEKQKYRRPLSDSGKLSL